MSTGEAFGTVYADHYDQFYQSKDYNAECDFLAAVFGRYTPNGIQSILDLGCGTGGHVLRLAQRGYRVVGVDRSPEMLRVAQQKMTPSANLSVAWHLGDLRFLELSQTFDAVIMMFAVLGYQTDNADLAAALACVRRHLAPGGLFVADFWYGPAVLTQGPSDRVAEWSDRDTRVLRLVRSQLDTLHQTVQVRYHVLRLRGQNVASETKEIHTMRYLFAQELAYFAAQAGLEVVCLVPMLDLDGIPGPDTWNVSAVLRAADILPTRHI